MRRAARWSLIANEAMRSQVRRADLLVIDCVAINARRTLPHITAMTDFLVLDVDDSDLQQYCPLPRTIKSARLLPAS